MGFFSKKDLSLADEIKRVITSRILWSLFILFLGILVLSILNISSSFNQLRKNVQGQCAILSEFTISQLLINNESAVKLNLDNINASNHFIHFMWVKSLKTPPADQITWSFPLSWTEYCAIQSQDGEQFGYFKVTESLFYNDALLSEMLVKIGLAIFFSFVIFLLLHPLSKRIPERIFIRPIMQLLQLLKNGSNHSPDADDSHIPIEIREIKLKMIHMLKEAESHSREVAFGQIAAKVAHDIRSPLAALNMLLTKNAASLPEEERNIIRSATQRINDIANNLLNQKKATNLKDNLETFVVAQKKIKPELAAILLENIISEKRAQYSERDIQFKLQIDENLYGVFVNVNADELSRALSNLINNSVEAITGQGTVTLTLSQIQEKYLLFSLSDNGKGMLPEQLSEVLKNKVSLGKENGSGIGLSSAIQSIESWNGTFSIKSQFGKGTQVDFTLPISIFDSHPDFIFIDDSIYLTDAWKAQAKLNGKKIIILNSIQEVNNIIDYFSKDTPLYIDSNLGDNMKGENLAKTLHEQGFTTIYLCTGMDESEFPEMPWIKKIIGKEYPEDLL